ncbi:MAG: DoxX family membrane protein [Terrimicrobiaceae bacterium]
MFSFFHTTPGLAPVFLRLVLVAIFLFHGGQKCFGWFGGEGWMATLAALSEIGLPTILGAVVMIVEFVIAPLLLLGFLTRLAALLGCGLMFGSLYFIYGGSAFLELQAPLLVLASCLALLFSGGGGLSIDRAISSALLPPIHSGGLRLT